MVSHSFSDRCHPSASFATSLFNEFAAGRNARRTAESVLLVSSAFLKWEGQSVAASPQYKERRCPRVAFQSPVTSHSNPKSLATNSYSQSLKKPRHMARPFLFFQCFDIRDGFSQKLCGDRIGDLGRRCGCRMQQRELPVIPRV